ncbi:putative peptidase family-domain-containing protein [Dichotomopilus funicola]|uniref:Peptidase family-domain-containing protein n=1 Tax=Dichotomopilus funicola TaxID=1934379 RepID=A0AAN6VC47_9PEZI|nr:putative peptidase family-domain-containing protein [Dichotomopilus funicola]
MIQLDNFATGPDEVTEVYQRCILVSGTCSTTSSLEQDEGSVVVNVSDDGGQPLFSEQRWPMCQGNFKALVLLSPGPNKITVTTKDSDSIELSVRYVPLLQTPPLYLAIMIAKDSPLLIDCPPAKFGGLSSAHSSLAAAIAKFRITAYMWQALTAEDLRAKGLGRRAFRLEEEWTTDTLTQPSLHNPQATGSVPKIHLVRTDKTVSELRDANLAQQNPRANRADELHTIFEQALLAHGAPFTTHTRPIVAGLILDSHYAVPAGGAGPNKSQQTSTPYILAHAALGAHHPSGLSLGIFGSHLTYSWPRYLEEIPSCLLDATPPGDTVGNDNGECTSMARACAVGQGAFLHEDGVGGGLTLDLACDAGIAEVRFTSKDKAAVVDEEKASIANPVKKLSYRWDDIGKRFVRWKPLALQVTAMNGQQYTATNIWNMSRNRASIRIPGTDIRLLQQSVDGDGLPHHEEETWTWAVLFKKRDAQGKLVPATKIDIRVGCGLDGAVVYYKDGSKVPCGPRGESNDNDPHMGGHQARMLALPQDAEVTKVAVETLVPSSNHKIIGFCGVSGTWGMCNRFGIITAPRDVALPDTVYDMEELQNRPAKDRTTQHRNKRRRLDEDHDEDEQMGESSTEDNADTDDESCDSEGEDANYDDGSDSEVERVYQRG